MRVVFVREQSLSRCPVLLFLRVISNDVMIDTAASSSPARYVRLGQRSYSPHYTSTERTRSPLGCLKERARRGNHHTAMSDSPGVEPSVDGTSILTERNGARETSFGSEVSVPFRQSRMGPLCYISSHKASHSYVSANRALLHPQFTIYDMMGFHGAPFGEGGEWVSEILRIGAIKEREE